MAQPNGRVEGAVAQQWAFQLARLPATSTQHFKNFLRYAAERQIIDQQQFHKLITTFEHFVDEERPHKQKFSHPPSDDAHNDNHSDDEELGVDSEGEPALPACIDVLAIPTTRSEIYQTSPSYSYYSASSSSSSSSSASSSSGASNRIQACGCSSSSVAAPSSCILPVANSELATDLGFSAEFLTAVADAMEHPVGGVKVGRRRYLLTHYDSVFVARESIDWMIHRGYTDSREVGVRIGRALALKGHIVPVFATMFLDDDQFFRFTKHLQVPPPTSGSCLVLSKLSDDSTSSLIRLAHAVHENSVLSWLENPHPDVLKLAYPTVLLWSKQTRELMELVARKLIAHSEHDPALRTAVLGFMMAESGGSEELDPLFASIETTAAEKAMLSLISSQPPSDRVRLYAADRTVLVHPLTHQECIVELKKEFFTSARPVWLKFFTPSESDRQPILPDLIGKFGDDLRKDLCVQLIFKAFETLWCTAKEKWCLGRPPYVRTTRVLVTNALAGYIECVDGRTIQEVTDSKAWQSVDLFALAPSIVGSMISGFVLGVRDRHSENWMLLDEDTAHPTLMQIDFGYILMENPGGLPIDTPRLTMQPELIKLLRETPSYSHNHKRSLLDDVRSDLVTAFKILRHHYPQVVTFSKTTLSSLYTEDQVESFMWGKNCFRVGEEESETLEWFEEKVRSQLVEHYGRREFKRAIVSAYYSVRSVIGTIHKGLHAVREKIFPSNTTAVAGTHSVGMAEVGVQQAVAEEPDVAPTSPASPTPSEQLRGADLMD